MAVRRCGALDLRGVTTPGRTGGRCPDAQERGFACGQEARACYLEAMRFPASIHAIARVAAVLAAMAAAAACTHAGGKLMVDVPKLLPYQPPDADEIAGIDSDEDAPGTGSGSAQIQHK